MSWFRQAGSASPGQRHAYGVQRVRAWALGSVLPSIPLVTGGMALQLRGPARTLDRRLCCPPGLCGHLELVVLPRGIRSLAAQPEVVPKGSFSGLGLRVQRPKARKLCSSVDTKARYGTGG